MKKTRSELARELTVSGLCWRCGKKKAVRAVKGKTLCKRHLNYVARRERTLYQARIDQKVCPGCGKRSTRGGRTWCHICRKARAAAKAAHPEPSPHITSNAGRSRSE